MTPRRLIGSTLHRLAWFLTKEMCSVIKIAPRFAFISIPTTPMLVYEPAMKAPPHFALIFTPTVPMQTVEE